MACKISKEDVLKASLGKTDYHKYEQLKEHYENFVENVYDVPIEYEKFNYGFISRSFNRIFDPIIVYDKSLKKLFIASKIPQKVGTLINQKWLKLTELLNTIDPDKGFDKDFIEKNLSELEVYIENITGFSNRLHTFDTAEDIAMFKTEYTGLDFLNRIEALQSIEKNLVRVSSKEIEKLKQRAFKEVSEPIFKEVYSLFSTELLRDGNIVYIPKYHISNKLPDRPIQQIPKNTSKLLSENPVDFIDNYDKVGNTTVKKSGIITELMNNVRSVFLMSPTNPSKIDISISAVKADLQNYLYKGNKEKFERYFNEFEIKTKKVNGVTFTIIEDPSFPVTNEFLEYTSKIANKVNLKNIVIGGHRLAQLTYLNGQWNPVGSHGVSYAYIAQDINNGEYFTAVHEILGHPIIGSIKQRNPKLFNRMYKEVLSTDLGKAIKNQLPSNYEKSELAEEIVVRYITHVLGSAVLPEAVKKDKGTFISEFLKKYLGFLNDIFKAIFGVDLFEYKTKESTGEKVLDLESLPSDMTLNDLIRELVDTTKVEGIVDLKNTKFSIDNKFDEWSKNIVVDNVKNVYRNKKTNKEYQRITDEVIGGLSHFLNTKKGKSSIEDRADKIWGKNDPDQVLNTNLGPMTKQEYIDRATALRDSATIKGKIMHLKLQKAVGKWSNKLETELQDLLGQNGYSEKMFNWIDDNIKLILDRIGTNYLKKGIKPEEKDELYFEQVIPIDELGLAGSADIIIKHADGTYSIVDLKTGFRFNDSYLAEPFRYGDQGSSADILWSTAKNKAHLQKMLYAFGLKANDPNVQIKRVTTLWLPSKHYLKSPLMVQNTQVEPYIKMIEKVFSEDFGEELELIKNRVGKEQFKKLFDPIEYRAGYSHQVTKDEKLAKGSNQKLLDLYMSKLRHLVMYDPNPFSSQALKGAKKKTKKAAKLTSKILELLEKDDTLNLDIRTWNKDIGDMSLYLGTRSTIPSAYVRIFNSLLTAAEQKVNNRFQAHYNKFRSLLEPILQDYYRRKGTLHKSTRGLIGKIDKEELYGFARIAVKNESGEIVDYRFRVSDADWQDAIKTYSYINSSNVHIYRNFVDYINKSYAQFFVDEKSKYGTAVANKVATYRFKAKDGSPYQLTNLDLHNGIRPSRPHQRKLGQFEYSEGFYPKVFKTIEEYPTFSKEQLREIANREFSFYLEHNYELQDSSDEAIPMKYLGSITLNAQPELYSVDLEHQFTRFMKTYLRKEELDDIYVFGKGLTYYLKHKDDENFQKTQEYLEFALKDFIKGIKMEDSKIVEKSLKRVSPSKVASVFMKAMSIPTLGLNLVGGTANGIFITIHTTLAGIKNSILKRNISKGLPEDLLGIKGNEVGFTIKDLNFAWKEFWKMTSDIMSGNQYNNKMFLLLNKFNYLPNNWDWALSSELMKTTGNKLFSLRTVYMFYSLPEEVIASVIMAAQLKSMRIIEGEHKGKSLWDMYEVVQKKDENGNPYSVIEWVKDKDGNPVSRGVVKTPNGYEKVTELTSGEIERLFYVYEQLHGGYRDRDRMKVEMTIWGRMFFQFKKFLPNLLRQAAVSSHENPSLGRFVPTGEEVDGEKVVKWVSQVMEGRWKVLAKFMSYYAGIRVADKNKDVEEMTAIERLFNSLNIAGNENYAWDELDTSQKEAIIDAMQTLSLWAFMGVLGFAAFGGNTDDPWYKFYHRIMGDLTANYNPFEFGKNLKNFTPVSWKKGYDTLDSTATVFTALSLAALGDEDAAWTQDGSLRGFKSFIRNVPLASGVYRVWRQYQDTGEIDDYFPVIR